MWHNHSLATMYWVVLCTRTVEIRTNKISLSGSIKTPNKENPLQKDKYLKKPYNFKIDLIWSLAFNCTI